MATYSQAGAAAGFALLWTAWITFPLMATIQEIADRTALTSGRSLGELAAQKWRTRPARVVLGLLMLALVAANLLCVTADLVAVGEGMSLLHLGPSWLWALAAGAVITGAVMLGSFERLAHVFKLLCLALLLYVVVAIIGRPPPGEVLRGMFLPTFSTDTGFLTLLLAVLGTTISPYLLFWQSAHRIEDMRDEDVRSRAVPLHRRRPWQARRKLRAARLDVIAGMLFANLVMFSIIVSAATTLNRHGQTNLNSAADVAKALEPVAGQWSSALFALGFIGTGLLAIPVFAGSGAAAVAGLLGKRFGFSRSPREAPVFYGFVALGTVGGSVLTLTPADPIQLLIVSVVVNGVLAAPFLAMLMVIASDGAIMGHHRNRWWSTVVGWFTVALMAGAALMLLTTTL